ncbi:MAG: CBS domain-containing protein [Chloroflexi bacterium]|jgi:acetoin utilization protein AcuB|nr:CBS domain-containing protein [Chloroflexota bacterium]
MTEKPITALPETTHRQAVEIMRENNIHHLPIMDRNGKLVGIVVEEDLLRAQPSPATTLSIYEIHSLLSRLQLKQIMQHPVQTVAGDCPLEEAARLMYNQNIGCLPVMEDNELVGIITDTDIFQAFMGLLGGGQEGARFTLRLADKPGMLAQVAKAVADAGGNIISATAWRSTSHEDAYITIKERGAVFSQLMEALQNLDVEIVDARERVDCPSQKFGS